MVDELEILALDIIETIEREDRFDYIKQHGGFVKVAKAKEVLDENWNYV